MKGLVSGVGQITKLLTKTVADEDIANACRKWDKPGSRIGYNYRQLSNAM